MCFFFILCKNKHFGFLSNYYICVHTTAPPQKMSTETTKKTTDAQQNGAGKLCFLLLCLTRTAHLDWRVILTIVFFAVKGSQTGNEKKTPKSGKLLEKLINYKWTDNQMKDEETASGTKSEDVRVLCSKSVLSASSSYDQPVPSCNTMLHH